MTRLVAYCGLVCSECGAYLATQANDPAAIEAVAARWRVQHSPHITAKDVPCDGCAVEGKKCAHCAECDIRACGIAHGVQHCAECAEYPCARNERFFAFVPQARETLDALRAQ